VGVGLGRGEPPVRPDGAFRPPPVHHRLRLLAMEVWELGSSMAAYALSLEVLTRYGRHMFIVIVCAMIYFHLCTIKPQHPRRFASSPWCWPSSARP
jgi:hypothetical protein